MGWLGDSRRRLWYLLNRRRFDAALRQDMAAHRAAMADPRRFGSLARLGEEARDVWGWRWLDDLAQDVRLGLRGVRRAPGVSLVVVLTLGLATGATTALFSVVDGVLLRPLPFAEPERLVQIYGRAWREERGPTAPDPVDGPVASPELAAFAGSRALAGLAAYDVGAVTLDGTGRPERVPSAQVDLGLFDLLGADARVGRVFRDGDAADVAVIGERLWRRRFQADPGIAGRVIAVDGRPRIIVGVMPDAFQFPYAAASILASALPEARTEVWTPLPPLRADAGGALRRGRLRVVARLAPGVSGAQAQAELAVAAAGVEAAARRAQGGSRIRVGVRLASLADVVLGPVRRSLWLLFAAVGLVLAAACANVANLLLARIAARTREVVTRAALGASRGRLVRQFIAESLVLALAGGLVGALVAYWGTTLLVTVAAAKIPRAHEVALDWRSFAFLLGVCAVTALGVGLAPAWTAAKVDVRQATGTAGHATPGRGYTALRDALIVVEVALAFVLATGAALVLREAARLERMPSGMQEANVLTLHLAPRGTAAEYDAIVARLVGVPGVTAAGVTQLLPLQHWGWEADFAIRGRPSPGRMTADLRYVSPGYFAALGVPMRRGRGFLPSDTAAATPVVIVNETLARRYFPGEDPVGRALDRGLIVGVVGDVHQVGLDRPPVPEISYPMAQNLTMVSEVGMSLVVRTTSAPEAMAGAIRAAVREVAPGFAIFNVRTLEAVRADSLWELRLYRWLIGLFAGLTLLLAGIGLFGVIAYHASSRLPEFALRLALGSGPAQVRRLVFARGLRLTAVGLAAGWAATALLGPVLRHVSSILGGDVSTSATVGLLLLGIAGAACAVPAWRAGTVEPMQALRHD